ncbi:MAG: hypothetical protein WC326_02230 [Candidatus Delongbacteria bacterium]
MTEQSFHIPVMGTGFTIDTPLRVAPLGIDSCLSLVDDVLIEQMREALCLRFQRPFEGIPRKAEDSRARRITAYLDLLHELVQEAFDEIRHQPFFQPNQKERYFRLLPDGSALRRNWETLLARRGQPGCEERQQELTRGMKPGSIDVNIMAKLDRVPVDVEGRPGPPEQGDALAALRGFANSRLEAAVVVSAGLNKRLYKYMAQFRDFYRDAEGRARKRIIVKVSDFRSALAQGKLLAGLGLEVFEYRVESGLNCGGHAFGSGGRLLNGLLAEFRERREQLRAELRPLVESCLRSAGLGADLPDEACRSRLTVQGGLGVHGEAARLHAEYQVDATGWASPFLLVPEVTRLDPDTRRLLAEAGPDDLYLSDASPLGVPFHNLRRSSSETWSRAREENQKPGSNCPKGYLVSSVEFGPRPLCTASAAWQRRKLELLDVGDVGGRRAVLDKACICDHLGNGALMELDPDQEPLPVAVCPGPNLAWFNREYSLEEMVDHIHGRICLTPAERPHHLAAELVLNVDQLERLRAADDGSESCRRRLEEMTQNLEREMSGLLTLAAGAAYPGENLASIPPVVAAQRARLEALLAPALADC